ncbi:DUF3800 domain-containing protein [Methylococcus sp. EFPC2]|uniref:DUF3800 domain-containing protein n=1 Tax=Methylococcus sp. EFPC2 TaxID=2812648 RepID=UPI001967015B|nr:DUF3800 domain-containing protein [Methylococcus sp. EFPC2]QSA98492.1 DUF3800 domain-containing protein [Methylococcus sp. EFPC2]
MTSPDEEETLHIFVDEAGDPTLFANRRRAIVGTEGCSRFFIMGKLEVDDPAGLDARLNELRERLTTHAYFHGVPSFDPARGKTAVMFHAKDDLPEVRFQVFDLLASVGDQLRFHAVVCDKERVLQDVRRRNETDPDYWYNHNELYDGLMLSLFGKFHRLADAYRVCIARRGQSDRNDALCVAIDHAERDFVKKFGFGRGGSDVWEIRVSTPKNDACLQAVDYFLWAVQRFYEPRVDSKTGASLRDERYLKVLWQQIGEIHDLDFGPTYGSFFNKQCPLTLEERFLEGKRKKNKP